MKRLKKLASYTKGSKRVCDIGCDHAYALIYAILEYGVEYGIAADIAKGPLENAHKTIQLYHLESKIKTILSDGFLALDGDEFDTAILAGMGGILMTSILEKGYTKIKNKTLILEANSDMPLLRRFLFTHHFTIVEEDLIFEDGKYYPILLAKPGESKWDEYDILYGPILRRSKPEAFLAYYHAQEHRLLEILDKMKDERKKEEKRKEQMELSFLLRWYHMEKHFISSTSNFYRTYFIDDQARPMIVIAPGGAYKYTSPRESEPVAQEFLKRGYHVAIVNYRETVEDTYPLPGKYLAQAIKEIRLDSRVTKLIGLGFSAGGHCILEVCLHHEAYQMPNLDLLMLGYPVISSDISIAHMESFKVLLKENEFDTTLRNYLSLEKEVTKGNAVDLFLWGTQTDPSVSMINSLRLIEAYHRVGGNVEYHLFPMGGHGLSVANEDSSEGNKEKESAYIARWVDFADIWIKEKLK